MAQGHAGTVPMKLRQDAAAAAAEAMVWIERHCGGGRFDEDRPQVAPTSAAAPPAPAPGAAEVDDSLVCTTGAVTLWPGASNVIAGAANYSIDIR